MSSEALAWPTAKPKENLNMADENASKLEQVKDAIKDALDPNGPAVKDRDPDSKIQTEPTEVNTPDVDLVDAGYDVPEVHVSNLDRKLDDEYGVYVPPEGRGTLEVSPFLDAKRPEEVFDADDSPEPSEEDRVQAASEGRTAREVAESKQS
jgi:hypothetical protein